MSPTASGLRDGTTRKADLFVLATGYKGPDHLLTQLFGADVAKRVGRVWGFDDATQELRNMWTRTPQPGLWFTGGAFSQARIYSRYIALQIDAIEAGRLGKAGWQSSVAAHARHSSVFASPRFAGDGPGVGKVSPAITCAIACRFSNVARALSRHPPACGSSSSPRLSVYPRRLWTLSPRMLGEGATEWYSSAFSRRISPEVLQFVHALQSRGRRECRAPAGTRGLVCK